MRTRERGDSSEANVRIFLRKNFGFFEIHGVSARTRRGGGVKPVRTFFGQEGREINFSRFGADVFYGRLQRDSTDNNPESSLVVFLGKALNGIPR